LRKTPFFRPKLAKIAENCDHNIDPWSHCCAAANLLNFIAALKLICLGFYLNFDMDNHLNAQQGCQMVCFQTKNTILGKFLGALEWMMLQHFMVVWNILRSIGIFYGIWQCYGNLVYFALFWYIVSRKIWQP
jgi:hypothetical protein